jgi:hypothetical protein
MVSSASSTSSIVSMPLSDVGITFPTTPLPVVVGRPLGASMPPDPIEVCRRHLAVEAPGQPRRTYRAWRPHPSTSGPPHEPERSFGAPRPGRHRRQMRRYGAMPTARRPDVLAQMICARVLARSAYSQGREIGSSVARTLLGTRRLCDADRRLGVRPPQFMVPLASSDLCAPSRRLVRLAPAALAARYGARCGAHSLSACRRFRRGLSALPPEVVGPVAADYWPSARVS